MNRFSRDGLALDETPYEKAALIVNGFYGAARLQLRRIIYFVSRFFGFCSHIHTGRTASWTTAFIPFMSVVWQADV